MEIKSFSSGSVFNAFHTVLGQYLDYQEALKEAKIDRKLYIAISEESFLKIDSIPFIKRRITQFNLKLIVVNLETETILSWQE